MKNPVKSKKRLLGFVFAALALASLGACSRNPLSGSKLTSANYDQITLGMSKAQVETILGPPTRCRDEGYADFQEDDLSL